jgi:hypothetical protein
MMRRREAQKRVNDFARDIALYEMRKLPLPNPHDLWVEDPGWPIDIDVIFDTYWPYRKHKILPRAGGWLDQDVHLIEAFNLLDREVEWHKQNEKKRGNLPTIEDVYKKRREHLQGKS